MSHEVEDTAFVIAHYRAQDPSFSKDVYAYLWKSKEAANIAKQFETRVTKYDAPLHCARNRAILDFLHKYSSKQPSTCIINIGAGFSMYPYAMATTIAHIEVDLPKVTAYKKKKINTFIKQQKLPKRHVNHLSFNITKKEGLLKLNGHLTTCTSKRKIILLEGLFYFLSLAEIEQILTFCRETLATGDILICESYAEEIESTEVYRNLLAFFTSEFSLYSQERGNLKHSFYENLYGFRLLERTSSFAVSKIEEKLPHYITEEKVLNEHIYVLEKI